ncbi:MAG: helix-turn-helix transcriptional regulator [Thermoleophilia bacterium]|nr:helix-turn-helix transcriptional regulator [Thermoleophilia bacterium]
MPRATQPSIRCGALVRATRIRRGLSQEELGHRLGMAQSAISRIERDLHSPSLDTVGQILGAMGATLSLRAVSLNEPLPAAGNQTIAELRRAGRLSAEERMLEAVELSETATRLVGDAG